MSRETRIVNKYKDPFDIYIGRGTIWGNPFQIGRDGGREKVILKYKEYILDKPELLKELPKIKGRILGCFCKPKTCHGDVLADLCDEGIEYVRQKDYEYIQEKAHKPRDGRIFKGQFPQHIMENENCKFQKND